MAWIPNVNPNELIESQWGNTIRDHVVHTFASVTERDAVSGVPNGAMCITLDTGTEWVRRGGVWQRRGPLYHALDMTAFEGADIGTAGVAAASWGMPVELGRVYQFSGYCCVIGRAGTWAATGQLRVDSTVLTTRDTPQSPANVSNSLDQTVQWKSDRNGSATFTVFIAQAWYGTVAIRMIKGPGQPLGMSIRDVGVPA